MDGTVDRATDGTGCDLGDSGSLAADELTGLPETSPAERSEGLPDGLSEGLSERDREMLRFERQWWKYAGAKEQAIRDRFGMTATRYYQVLNALIDRPEALAHDAVLVKRLRRLRSTRQRARNARRSGGR